MAQMSSLLSFEASPTERPSLMALRFGEMRVKGHETLGRGHLPQWPRKQPPLSIVSASLCAGLGQLLPAALLWGEYELPLSWLFLPLGLCHTILPWSPAPLAFCDFRGCFP